MQAVPGFYPPGWPVVFSSIPEPGPEQGPKMGIIMNTEQKKSAAGIVQWLLALNCFLFLVSVSVTAVLNFRPLYYADMKSMNLAAESGYSEEVIRLNYDRLIDYNNLGGSKELVFEEMPMSEGAAIHFREVRRIFILLEALAVITGVILAGTILFCVRTKQIVWLKRTAILAFVIPSVLGILVLNDWEAVFIEFHRLVFSNDYWLFDPAADPIITVLPDR